MSITVNETQIDDVRTDRIDRQQGRYTSGTFYPLGIKLQKGHPNKKHLLRNL